MQLRDLVISRLVPQAEADRVCMWANMASELRNSVCVQATRRHCMQKNIVHTRRTLMAHLALAGHAAGIVGPGRRPLVPVGACRCAAAGDEHALCSPAAC